MPWETLVAFQALTSGKYKCQFSLIQDEIAICTNRLTDIFRSARPSKYGPYYVQSFGAELAIFAFAILCAFALRTYLKHLNKKLDASEQVPYEVTEATAKHTANLEGKVPGDVVEDVKGFRYLY